MCQSMVDIQPAAAEIRGGKKRKIEEEEDRKKPQGKNIMAPYYIGRPYLEQVCFFPTRGTKHVFRANLSQIRSAIPGIRKQKSQTAPKTEPYAVHCVKVKMKLECGPMPNVMAVLPNISGALCSTRQSLADAHCWSAVQ